MRIELPRLYIITDRASVAGGTGDLVETVTAAGAAGARLFQFRDKDVTVRQSHALGREIAASLAAFDATWLVNDRADLCEVLDADGVHLPGDGLPIDVARRLMESNGLVGASCHSVEEVAEAESEGADLVTLSPIFESKSKPGYGPTLGLDGLREATEAVNIPVYALAGVTPERCMDCLDAGAYGVAVMSGIMAAGDPYEATRAYLGGLGF